MCATLKLVQKGRNAKRGVGVLGVKIFLKLVQKERNAKRGVGAKRVGAKQFRTWVRKKIFGRFAPAPT